MPDVDSLFEDCHSSENVEETATSSSKQFSESLNVISEQINGGEKDFTVDSSISCDHDGNYINGIRTLATVMENLPLSQDTFMHHKQQNIELDLSESDIVNLSVSDKLSVNNADVEDIINIAVDNLSQSNISSTENQSSTYIGEFKKKNFLSVAV